MCGTMFLITYFQKCKNTIECLVRVYVCFLKKKCVFYVLSTSSRSHNFQKQLQQYHSKLLLENWKRFLKCSQNAVFKHSKLRIVTQIFFVKLSYQTFYFRVRSFQCLDTVRYCLNSNQTGYDSSCKKPKPLAMPTHIFCLASQSNFNMPSIGPKIDV